MSERRIIPGSEKRHLTGAKKIGPVDPQEIAEVTIILKLPPGKEAALSAAGGGASPKARKLMSREDLAREISAAPEALIKIEDFARAHRIEVIEASAERRSVVLEGTLAALQEAFGVELGRWIHPEQGEFRGRSGPITVPAEIADIVDAVLGLDTRPAARPHVRRVEARSAAAALAPTDVARLYDFPTDATGKGQTIGVIELGGGFRLSELRTYFHGLGLATPPVVQAVSVDRGRNRPGVDPNADGEVMLDIEVAGAVAPGARIVVYFAPNTDRGFLDAITHAVHDNHFRPSVISISWGSAEGQWTDQALRVFNTAFQAASAVGVTVCAAAGDAGSSDGVRDGLAHVDFPASSPFVLACGGTRLLGIGGTINAETVWNDAADSATGGGVSDVFDVPSWQADARVPSSANGGGRRGRGVPDVCGDADPVTGYKVLVDGQSAVIGGTSAVAPLWSGLVALLNEKLKTPVGYLQPFLYANPSLLRDVTQGNNGAYSAGAGWDACTGLGSPKGKDLASALQGS
jgi:kumamolisin